MDPVVYFFALGLAARLLRSDLKLPGVLYESLTIYLLIAIGIKGGVELASHPYGPIAIQVCAALGIGLALPLIAFPLLRYAGKFSHHDAGGIAAHYGSVSVVTFAVGTAFLAQRSVAYEAYMPLFVALLEAPGIVVGIILGRMGERARTTHWPALLREILLGKSIVLLLGGLAIGWLAGPVGVTPLKPFFYELFKGALCLFLLEMGLIVGAQVRELRKAGAFLIGFGVLMPLAAGSCGAAIGTLVQLSVGGATLLAILAASASYIAAPAAVRIALPQANPGLSLAAALGVTFPFNIAFGIPLYYQLAQILHAWSAT
jgi:hypothetical protein